jgi:hypothetical protein
MRSTQPFRDATAPHTGATDERDAAGERAAASEPSALLDSLLERSAFIANPLHERLEPGASLVGVCIDDRHPHLHGRVRVHWKLRDAPGEAWLPKLQHVPVRRGDQVLLTQPANGAEPIVVGVVDGFAQRDAPAARAVASLELQADEVVRIDDAHGRPLLELRADESGPVVKLVRAGLSLEIEGKLAFRADAILLEAKSGAVEIHAADDVCVKGEVINLN